MLSYDAGGGLPKAIRRFFYLCCALCSVEAPGFSRSMGFDPIMTTPLPIGERFALADLGIARNRWRLRTSKLPACHTSSRRSTRSGLITAGPRDVAGPNVVIAETMLGEAGAYQPVVNLTIGDPGFVNAISPVPTFRPNRVRRPPLSHIKPIGARYAAGGLQNQPACYIRRLHVRIGQFAVCAPAAFRCPTAAFRPFHLCRVTTAWWQSFQAACLGTREIALSPGQPLLAKVSGNGTGLMFQVRAA